MTLKFLGETLHPKKKKFILRNFPNISRHKVEIDLSIFQDIDIDHFIKFSPQGAYGYRLSNKETTQFDDKFSPVISKNHVDGLEYAGIRKTHKTEHKKIYPCIRYHEKRPQKKICFLDRDGVLIQDTEYPHGSNIQFNRSIIEKLKQLKNNGFEFIVITNQSGIARNFFSKEQYLEANDLIHDWLLKHEIKILQWFHCPYHLDGQAPWNFQSILRKPLPGMILEASQTHSINLSDSIIIGDKQSDNLYIGFARFVHYIG